MYRNITKPALIIVLLTWFGREGRAQTIGFVQEDKIKVASIISESQISALSIKQKQTVRTYFDGLGRPVQTVVLKASPNNDMDIIQPMAYDNLGRQTKGYLSYVGADSSGTYRPNALITEQAAFYSNGTSDKIADDSSPFAQQVFDNSPMQRMLKAGSVGNNFQPLTGQHFKTVAYRPNTVADNVSVIYPNGTFSGTYAANVLSVTDGTDEDGGETLIFKDLAGHLVLKRQLANQAGETYFDTYYVYNNSGAVSYIIPPKATHLILTNGYTLTQTAVSKLIYKYVYDSYGRVVERTVPGSGVMYVIYDPLNRPVLMQDSNMRIKKQWNYIKYDAKGRAISQGVYTDVTYTSRTAMQGYVSALTGYTSAWYESRNNSATNEYYTNNIFPSTNITPLAYSYYDDYDWNQDGVADYIYQSQGWTGEATPTSLTRGMLTMVLKRTVGQGLSNIWLTSVLFYDKYGHVIQTRSNNQLNYTVGVVTDVSTVMPDFMGKPLMTKVVKVTGTGTANTNTVTTTLTYDKHNTALQYIDQQYNTQATVRVASYSYNELGQLVTKNLGNTTGTNYLQTLDYRYNIRGQLTSINNSKLKSDTGVTNNDLTDVFGMQLLYDQSDSNLGNTASYTGRITGVKWMTKDHNNVNTNERAYKYSYDILNRLTAANYAERATTGTGSFNLNTGGFDESGITYDDNGNILTLQRNSSAVGTTTHTKVDSLRYGYDTNNPNRLLTVLDGIGSNFTGLGFRNLTGSGSSYSYDGDGNLLTDPYKGLALSYNMLNKTDTIKVTTSANRYIAYTYNATGTVIRKRIYDNNILQNTTDYIDGFVYVNSTISYLAMPEGRVVNAGGTLKPEYIITDQQGNARFSFQDNGSGAVQIIQENSYYAFGLVMANSPVGTPSLPNKQLYNGGSEWQNDYSNLPDYFQTFYRNYDAALGRFIGVDPKPESSESLTTYNYAGNNPLMFNDPLGDIFSQKVQDAINDLINNSEFGGKITFDGSGGGGDDFSVTDYTSAEEAIKDASGIISAAKGWGAIPGMATSYANAIDRYNKSVSTDQQGFQGIMLPEVTIKDWSKLPAAAEASYNAYWASQGEYPGQVNYHGYSVSSALLRDDLLKFSQYIGQPINITSGDRSAARNRAAGGAKASRHLFGDAADMSVAGMTNRQLAILANQSDLFNTVIYYPVIDATGGLRPHTHVDLNPSHDNLFLIYTPTINNGVVTHNGYSPFK